MHLQTASGYTRHIFLSTFVFFIAACALSPQIIVIEPVINVQGKADWPRTLRLQVTDGRDSPIIGQRGGIYKNTSHISTSEDMTTTLRKSLAKALQKQGHTVSDGAADADLSVRVNDMYYTVHKGKVLYTIEVHVDVSAIIKKQGREFTGDYRATRKKDELKLPGIEGNEELVNEAMALVLEHMLTNDEFKKFVQE